MNIEIRLPDLGEDTVSEVTISEWLAEVGSELSEGDDLLELTTDKAAFCLPCPKGGVLVEQRVKVGDDLKVGDVVCILDV